MARKKTSTEEIITIKPIEVISTKIHIVGKTPLISHAWSAKAKRQILEKELGKAGVKKKEAKNPIEDFVSSMYWLTPMPDEFTEEAVGEALVNAKFGFPVTAFKQAAISAAYRLGWVPNMTSLRGSFFIRPDVEEYYGGDLEIDWDTKAITIKHNERRKEQLVTINSDIPEMREDMVRVGMGASDIRYRGEFSNWSVDLVIDVNVNGQYSLDNIINIINAGGYVCGVGEWRPEKDGQYGMFQVEG